MELKLRLKLFLPLILPMLFLWQNNSFAQARIVFGTSSDAFLVMSSNAVVNGNPIYLVVGDATGNLAANTIDRTGGHGGIISDGENNILKWYIGSTIANYTIPWYYNSSNYIPLIMNKTNAGTANKFFRFSTYRTATYLNSNYLPSGVTNCYSASLGGDASARMVDRFWMIDDADYTTPPTTDLTFYYVDGGNPAPEVTSASQTTLVEANLVAESYNNASNLWVGATYGTDYPASNYVGAPSNSVPAVFLYKWWTLVDKNTPLPVEFLSAATECENGNTVIKWSTATEQNSDHFTVEKSLDGTNFSTVATLPAAGNSNTMKNYSAVDYDSYSGTSYYRVKETDFNGDFMYSSNIITTGCSSDISIGVYPNPSNAGSPFNVAVAGAKDEEVLIVVTDMLGQEFYSKVTLLSTDSEVIAIDPSRNLAAGVYTVVATSNDQIIKKKIVIQ